MTDDVNGLVVDESDQVKTESEMVHVVLASGSYFSMLGVKAQFGHMLEESDDTSQGDHPVAVISQSFWQRAFAGAPGILGRKVKLGSAFFSVVGVAPGEFFGTEIGESPGIWVPTSMTKSVPA